MPRSTFTAFVEQHVFLLLLGDGELSPGVQRAVAKLAGLDDDGTAVMTRARELVAVEKAAVPGDDDDEATQAAVLRYIRAHWHDLIGDD